MTKRKKAVKPKRKKLTEKQIDALPMTKWDVPEAALAAVREKYLEYGPGSHSRIAFEMNKEGWDIGVSDLICREDLKTQGIIRKLGLFAEWSERERAARAEETIEDEKEERNDLFCPGGSRPSWEQMEARNTPASQGLGHPSLVRRGTFKFPDWLKEIEPKWTWDWAYQEYIYEALQRIESGELKRLMIFLPPRHGKSELVTVRFAAWLLTKRPGTNIIIGSYNQKLANRFSRKIRRIVNREEGDAGTAKGLLNTSDDWETAAGGGVKAVGVGAGVTGFGADLIIIDDPIKSRAEANSDANRERIWEWFNDDLHTRLEPEGIVILIQTRWHEDDLAGRLLNAQKSGGEIWEVIRLPALAERGEGEKGREGDKEWRDVIGRKEGEALCPKRFSSEALLAKKHKMGTASFESLYQQNPVPAEGATFKTDWFMERADEPPSGLKWYRGYDLAVSTKTSADYTASARVAVDDKGTLYIADMFRMRAEYPEQRKFIIERMQMENNTEHGIEAALHGKAIVQDLRRERHLTRHVLREIKVTVDKITRASAWAARAEARKVVLVQGPWIRDFLEELAHFPHGRHDDQIDAVSIAVQMVEKPKYRHAGF